MKHAVSRELYEYWNRVRGSEPAPPRSAIEPSDLRRVLPDTFILEVNDREHYSVRLAGTRVCALYCRELKGTNRLDLWQAEDRSAMATLAAAVSEDGAAAVVTVDARTARNDEISCEMVLLPLRNGGAAYERVLGSLAPFGRPHWFGNEPVVRQTITSLRLIWPQETPQLFRRRTDIAPAQARPTTTPSFVIPHSRRRRHLFVVNGGKE
jgi:hypothetical protein